MAFEVDSFDSSYMQIAKIAAEEGGFVATTDSEKLANGKVSGIVTVRVPPERLDTLVLKLPRPGRAEKLSRSPPRTSPSSTPTWRASSRPPARWRSGCSTSSRPARARSRTWSRPRSSSAPTARRSSSIEGELRYYNNLVSLSTLNVTLTERDIRTAALLSETEQVNMGVEAEDVEKARAAAIKAIEEAKGRIVESDLKKLEAGQFAGPRRGRRAARRVGPADRPAAPGRAPSPGWRSRKQTAPEGTVAPARGAASPRVERRDTRFLISLYNLANVAPRQTTNVNLAAEDVEVAYRAILDQVKSAGGRVVDQPAQPAPPRPDHRHGDVRSAGRPGGRGAGGRGARPAK